MTSKHDIWLTALQGHERAPLNDQDLKSAIGLVNAALDSVEALNSDHYDFIIHDLHSLRRKLLMCPNAERAMNPNVPSVGDLYVVQKAANVDSKWYGTTVSFMGKVEDQGDAELFQVRCEYQFSAKYTLVIDRKHLKRESKKFHPSIAAGQPKYNCVECGRELGSG